MQQYIWGRLLVSVFNVLALSFPLFYLSGLHTEAKVHFQFSSVSPEMGSFLLQSVQQEEKHPLAETGFSDGIMQCIRRIPIGYQSQITSFFLVLPVLQTVERKYHCSPDQKLSKPQRKQFVALAICYWCIALRCSNKLQNWVQITFKLANWLATHWGKNQLFIQKYPRI